MREQLQTLLHQEMTRKQFVITIGLLIASLTGLFGVVKALLFGSSKNAQQHATTPIQDHEPAGYGER